jgi:hypothetical protein
MATAQNVHLTFDLMAVTNKPLHVNFYINTYNKYKFSHSSKESYLLCKDYETEEETRTQQRAVEPLMNDEKK